MNRKQHEFILKAFKAHGIALENQKCAFCSGKLAGVVCGSALVRTFGEDGQPANVGTAPVVTLCCENCGHLETFSAIILGIMDQNTGKLKEDAP